MTNQSWMSDLPTQVRDLPIINLAIPGSHNSMSYGIRSDSGGVAPDANKSTRRLIRFFPCFVRRWAKTQSANILEQLQFGIRYFDLRVCQHNEKFYYAHALLAMEIFEPLTELRQYLDAHPGEVVILDFQHFYALSITHHMKLHKQLLELFGTRLYSNHDGTLADCTLNRCSTLKRQLVIIYRRCPITLPAQFWHSHVWPTPWPNLASAKKLRDYLQSALLTRKPQQGYVSQCVLTPTGRFIAFRFLSSLRRTVKNVDKVMQPWIEEQTPGPFDDTQTPKANVFLGDYINLKDGQFCNCVLQLNTKLHGLQLEQQAGNDDGQNVKVAA